MNYKCHEIQKKIKNRTYNLLVFEIPQHQMTHLLAGRHLISVLQSRPCHPLLKKMFSLKFITIIFFFYLNHTAVFIFASCAKKHFAQIKEVKLVSPLKATIKIELRINPNFYFLSLKISAFTIISLILQFLSHKHNNSFYILNSLYLTNNGPTE